jgi:hypothetical protein
MGFARKDPVDLPGAGKPLAGGYILSKLNQKLYPTGSMREKWSG